MKISCIQMDIAYGDVTGNFARAAQLIEEAITEQPDIMVLPELWTTGYDLTRLDSIADQDGKNSIQFLQDQARKHSVHLVAGSVAIATEEGIFNTLLVIDKQGKLIHKYHKAHLFKLMDEHHYLQAGKELGLFSLNQQPFAGVICYDIRFPEWLRAHTSLGAKALFVVAEWPKPRLAHWRALLIARAIENQCYVIACNRAGSDPANVFAGHSMIIDPWGDVISEGTEQESIITASINLAEVDKVRDMIPIFSDRRPDLYYQKIN